MCLFFVIKKDPNCKLHMHASSLLQAWMLIVVSGGRNNKPSIVKNDTHESIFT